MRSLSLRSGNSPTTPYGGRVNGLQILGFPPPCHPNYRALALTPAGLSPAERASLCWTHVGSRTGAPTVGSGGKSNHFRVGPQSGSHDHVSSPRLIKRSMRFSRTTLSCLLHVKGYAAYSAFAFTYIFRLRSCSSIGAFLISRFPPPALPGFTGTTSPSATLSPVSRFPGAAGYTAYLCSADFSTGRGGLLQLLSASSSPYRRYHPAGVP